MGFFNNDMKREGPKPKQKVRASRGVIPIASLNKMGCSVCPRDKDKDLLSPKMTPSGANSPSIYLMGTAPSEEEDARDQHWTDIAGRAIASKFSRGFLDRHVRSNHITQCMPAIGGPGSPGDHEIECCRGRIVADIEEAKPLVVVGVGDEPLHWATGLPRNAINFRGTLIATKIGNHSCWYYPILYPNYLKGKKRSNKSEYELTLEHDIAYIEQLVDEQRLENAVTYDSHYDRGIELITGQEPGDMQRLEEAFEWLLSLRDLSLDVETNGLRPYLITQPGTVAEGFSKGPHLWSAAAGTFDRTISFSIEHPEGWGTDTRRRKVLAMFGDFLRQSGRKRCHNMAFEQEWAAYFYGNQLLRLTEWDDTMAMAHSFDARKGTKALDTQCRVNFGFFLKAQSRVDVSRKNWVDDYPVKETLRYNGLDTKWTDKLADRQLSKLQDNPAMLDVYEGLVRLAPTLVLTSARGLPVDFTYAEDQVKEIDTKLAKIEERARRLPEMKAYSSRYGTFSFTNPDHALALMRDICKRDEVKRVDREGKVSWTSDEEALASIPAGEVPSAPLIVEHRQLTRCESTYLLPLLAGEMTGPDQLIHSEYQSMVAVTSRLASPMHNWPKHKHKEVRGAIAARGGEWFVAADYGQIEFRVAGMLSGDRNLIKYCWTGYDVHKFWAERIAKAYPRVKDWIVSEFSVDWDELGIKTLRQVAKNNWVFPQLFGATTRSCAANMHIDEDVADKLGGEFWDEFSGVQKWQERVMVGYERNLYVETLGGFRRRGPSTRNELINMPIQGTACEIVLAGMNAISERAQAEDDEELQPAFNGHDDLSFLIGDTGLERKIETIVHEMCKPRFDYINVPLKVEVSVGPRWHQLKEIATYSSVDLFNLENPYASDR